MIASEVAKLAGTNHLRKDSGEPTAFGTSPRNS